MEDPKPTGTPPPDTPAAGAPQPNPQASGDGGSAGAGAQPDPDAAEGAEAVGGTGTDAGEDEGALGGIRSTPLDSAVIQARETPDAFSQTIPLDLATLDDIADHVAEEFAVEVRRFMNLHPGVRHMVTIAVHAGGEIVHAADHATDLAASRGSVAAMQKLEQVLRTRFPNESIQPGETAADVLLRILTKAFPLSTADAGLAAATR